MSEQNKLQNSHNDYRNSKKGNMNDLNNFINNVSVYILMKILYIER